ncbi:MAG: hypothetical protein HQM14_15850, partial [SAR324 cluster bacterium]|nr:hypothetical protein [SAR324 cluster bacterium]
MKKYILLFLSALFIFTGLMLGDMKTASAQESVGEWTQVTAPAPWHERSSQASVVFKDKLWILGGYYDEPGRPSFPNDVWSTQDGVNWTQETPSADWPGRTH